MSYQHRFPLTDRLEMNEYASLMSEGNPGAVTVVVRLMKDEKTMGWLPILEDMNIRGAQLWVLYKDFCNQNFDQMKTFLANQSKEIIRGINEEMGPSYPHKARQSVSIKNMPMDLLAKYLDGNIKELEEHHDRQAFAQSLSAAIPKEAKNKIVKATMDILGPIHGVRMVTATSEGEFLKILEAAGVTKQDFAEKMKLAISQALKEVAEENLAGRDEEHETCDCPTCMLRRQNEEVKEPRRGFND